MKSEQLIVTTSVGSKTKTELWDTSTPIGIGHPFKWVLENTPNGVRVRDLGGPVNQVVKDAGVKVSNEAIVKASPITLPQVGDRKMVLTIRHAHIPKPAYTSRQTPVISRSQAPHLMVFEGLRRSLVNSQRVHSAYVAYAKGRPVFTVYHSPEGFRIKPLLNGVHLKLKGEKATQGKPGEFWDMNKDQLTRATIVRGWYWWRFNLVEPPAFLSDEDERDAVTVSENRVFRNTLIAVGIFLLLALLTTLWVGPPPEVPKEEPITPPTIKLMLHRLPPSPRKAVAQVAQVAAPTPKVQEQKDTGHKAGENKLNKKAGKIKPTKIAKVKPPAPVEAKVERAAPNPNPNPKPVKAPPKITQKPAETGAERVAKEAKNLKNMFGSASNITQRDVVHEVSAGSPNAGQLFDKSGVAYSPTEVHAGRVATGGRVEGVGGGGGGAVAAGEGGGSSVGYGTGDKGLTAGKGGGFVALDNGGSEVEEGLTKEEVGAVIHKHMSEVRYCHEAAMLANPKVEGKLMLAFTINAGGVVETAGIQSSNLQDHGLESCIIRRLVTWKFPHPKGGVKVHVSYPFLFKMLGGV